MHKAKHTVRLKGSGSKGAMMGRLDLAKRGRQQRNSDPAQDCYAEPRHKTTQGSKDVATSTERDESGEGR